MSSGILGIDTSDRSAEVAILHKSRLAAHRAADTKSVEQLPVLLSKCIEELQITFSDISRICVCIGPGSFTGIRAGLSFAQGLGISLGIPLVGVSSLLSRAHLALSHDGTFTIGLIASKQEYFVTTVKREAGSIVHLDAAGCVPRAEVAEDDASAPLILLDQIPGAQALVQFCAAADLDNLSFEEHCIVTDALFQIEPLYVKGVAAKTLKERGLR